MRRREFLSGICAAAVSTLAAHAQQPVMPVIGFLSIGSPESNAFRLTGFRSGLNESGYVEGRNFVVEYRWAGDEADRLPAMAAELARIRVTAIVTPGVFATLAAKAATSDIPILFNVGADPVQLGLVTSVNKPGGNLTGVNGFNSELGGKGFALLHELMPKVAVIGFLENPANPIFRDVITRDVLAAAAALGIKVQLLKASTAREIEAAFESLIQAQTKALFIPNDIFFNSRIEQIVALAARHALPVMYPNREFAMAGGLMSYGASLADGYRQLGIYAGQIFKGKSPSELPVIQPTKLELVINMKAAKALGLDVPLHLQQLADEVIE
jgi:putative tryptophan/tyrosine transport system substrate-binding protein